MNRSSDNQPAAPVNWHRVILAILACYWIAIFGGTHIPRVPLPTHFNFFDKFCHFGAFVGLTVLAHLAWTTRRPGASRLKWRDLAAVMLGIALYGAFDELTQPLVGRSREFLDWVADVAGVVFATLLFAGVWTFAHRRANRSSDNHPISIPPRGRLAADP